MTDARKTGAEIDLAELFREHSARLAGAVRGILGARADVQEILQDSFLSAWKAQAAGARPKDPVAWVFVLTLNLARDARRKALRRGPELDLSEVDAVRLAATEPEPAQRMESDETLQRTREAIFRLDEPEKEVFLLRVSGELSFSAIAEALDLPVGTAKSRMRAALMKLRTSLSGFAPGATGQPGLGLELEGDAR